MSWLKPMETSRLHLSMFCISDVPIVQQLAGDYDVAKTTLNILQPYEDGMAEDWVIRQFDAIVLGQTVSYAVTLRSDGTLIEAISLVIDKVSRWAELGYWIGKPYWNNGYCTKAAQALVHYGFIELGLNRIQARHMACNPASGQVMRKRGHAVRG